MSTNPRLFLFVGGSEGEWICESAVAPRGEPLAQFRRLSILPAAGGRCVSEAAWVLCGAKSNLRYAEATERATLQQNSPPLGRASADCAVLIPIRKNAAWWELPQDERRRIFEARSRHTAIGLEYLPAIARSLYHCRDLSTAEPFDFLTWFEFAAEEAGRFDDLLARLRASEEWEYVEREVEIRLRRAAGAK